MKYFGYYRDMSKLWDRVRSVLKEYLSEELAEEAAEEIETPFKGYKLLMLSGAVEERREAEWLAFTGRNIVKGSGWKAIYIEELEVEK